ncbi:response regulator, partial [Acinetobacter baumannii]
MPPPGQALDDLQHPPRVLLVDDDEVNLLLTAAALRERGFDVTETNNGSQALDQLSSHAPDVVVL